MVKKMKNKLIFYKKIQLLPDNEINVNYILNFVYSLLHIAFVDCNNRFGYEYAISFPDATEKHLGKTIIIFSNDQVALETLNLEKKLERINDYCHIQKSRPVPSNIKEYIAFKRIHINSAENKTKRFVKRHKNAQYNEVLKIYTSISQNWSGCFLKCKSSSTSQKFSLMLKKVKAEATDIGKLNNYGLSKEGIVPLPVF